MYAAVSTGALIGIEVFRVVAEVQTAEGKERFVIVGLGDSAVREARERVVSALLHAGIGVPPAILVNLSPANIRKEGSGFDLAIALGIAISAGVIKSEFLSGVSVHGELSLDGGLQSVRGVVARAIQAKRDGYHSMIVPFQNAAEAALIKGISIIGASSLDEIIAILRGTATPRVITRPDYVDSRSVATFSEVRGQVTAKRALLIAAVGAHNALLIGPPGCGKSMLSHRLSSLLPPYTEEELLEVIQVHSASGLRVDTLLKGERSFRAPHHSISDVGLIGGGNPITAGEISLAHRGVLFLDEFPEFRRTALESLRAPLENGTVAIARAGTRMILPARFQLIAAMNPCPCGRLGTPSCSCSPGSVMQYLRKLSQPILDRIDLHIELHPLPIEELAGAKPEEPFPFTFDDVARLRNDQYQRQQCLNAELSHKVLKSMSEDSVDFRKIISRAAEKQGLSARGLVRVLRVARSIADLECNPVIQVHHLAEALTFRTLEKLNALLTPCRRQSPVEGVRNHQ